MFKRYQYWVEAEYDHPELRAELERISQDRGHIAASLKEDRTASVWRAEVNAHSLVVKRYNTRGILHAIRRVFRKSRAENCKTMATIFAQSSIHTADNVALIQEWLGPFKLRSWFICSYIPGFLLQNHLSEKYFSLSATGNLDALKNNVAELFRKLRSQRLSHGDLKATNILLSDDQLFLIDLDAAHAHKSNFSFKRAHHKDQSRFMKNWLAQADIYQCFEPLINK